LGEPAGDGIHISLSLGLIDLGFEPGDDNVIVITAHCAFFVCPGERCPELCLKRKIESWGHHADYCVGLVIELDDFPQRIFRCSEVSLAKRPAQYDNISMTGLIVSGGE